MIVLIFFFSGIPPCEGSLAYRGGVDVCHTLCRDFLFSERCFPGVVQGCMCPEDEYLSDNDECTSKYTCTCYDAPRDTVYQPGEVVNVSCSSWWVFDTFLWLIVNFLTYVFSCAVLVSCYIHIFFLFIFFSLCVSSLSFGRDLKPRPAHEAKQLLSFNTQ